MVCSVMLDSCQTKNLRKAMQIYSKRVKFFINNWRNYTQNSHHQICKMNLAYFRHHTDSNQFQITFRLVNEKYKIDRTFNFSRYITENISTGLDRIKTNVEKEFLKKTKRKKTKITEKVSYEQSSPEVKVELFRDSMKLEDGIFSDILLPNQENLSLRIIDENFSIILNSPWVTNIILPSSILAGFLLYPSKLELEFTKKENCIFKWYSGVVPSSKNDKDIEWTEIGEGFTYNVKNCDIEKKIKVQCIPENEYLTGPIAEYISKCVVHAGPGLCPFEYRQQFTKEKLSGNAFRVMSYNLLADLYCDTDYAKTTLFSYCPGYALNIDYRKQLFSKEIIGYNSDIVCLQEVDSKIFDLDLSILLETFGYSGIFKNKGTSAEGLATFYQKDRFEFIKTEGINLGDNIQNFQPFEKLYMKIKQNKKLVERIVDRATAIQVTILKSKDRTDSYILVANTHLYFHPDADHIRLLQMGFSMLYIQSIIETFKTNVENEDKNIALIFCGDFNSSPDCGIYKLMTEKLVDEKFIDWQSNKSEAVRNVSLSQPYHMDSACGCPKYTNFTVGFAECLDYIFYQMDFFKVIQVIPMPSDEELKAHKAIPSVTFPSDHIAIVADLEWKN